ncbi:hypothetical protein TNIN_253941 [Trichonephila inaurata madagascariensis]|uniref:Uncharacterized protein n=1 Tax=Trichonephila inaurata madagascariensis TaxID=2747483 RepID=A0A8X6Y5B5_9ARAC|nr:hypothetical protein TNIN_253941 [Trichonephila inaurata madagascariensis]
MVSRIGERFLYCNGQCSMQFMGTVQYDTRSIEALGSLFEQFELDMTSYDIVNTIPFLFICDRCWKRICYFLASVDSDGVVDEDDIEKLLTKKWGREKEVKFAFAVTF